MDLSNFHPRSIHLFQLLHFQHSSYTDLPPSLTGRVLEYSSYVNLPFTSMSLNDLPLPDASSIEKPEWRKQVDEVQARLRTEVAAKLDDLARLQEERLKDIEYCHKQFLAALSTLSGQFAELDGKYDETQNEITKQRLKVDIQEVSTEKDRLSKALQAKQDQADLLQRQNASANKDLATSKDSIRRLEVEIDELKATNETLRVAVESTAKLTQQLSHLEMERYVSNAQRAALTNVADSLRTIGTTSQRSGRFSNAHSQRAPN